MNNRICILGTTLLIILQSCRPIKLNMNGSYIHNFKGGDNQITIINDSMLNFENNVSMMFTNITIRYHRNLDKIILAEKPDNLDEVERLVYPEKAIVIKNAKILFLGNKKFKFQKK